jgi:acyl carrier protein
MVPTVFVELDRLPRTAHGKIDRRALVWVDEGSAPATPRHVPSPTRTEERLAAIWSRVLNRDRIGLDEDFLELGGQSLAAIQCMRQIREHFGIDLPLITLFNEHASIRNVAATIVERTSRPGS